MATDATTARPDPLTFGPRRDDGFDDAAGQLGEYLAGQRTEFGLALGPRGDGFSSGYGTRSGRVPHGDTVTYVGLAGRLGREVTAQQVGAAVGRNPLCIVVPCHRVVGAAGRLTGYAGGLARKRHLLDLEQTGLPPCCWGRAAEPGVAVLDGVRPSAGQRSDHAGGRRGARRGAGAIVIGRSGRTRADRTPQRRESVPSDLTKPT